MSPSTVIALKLCGSARLRMPRSRAAGAAVADVEEEASVVLGKVDAILSLEGEKRFFMERGIQFESMRCCAKSDEHRAPRPSPPSSYAVSKGCRPIAAFSLSPPVMGCCRAAMSMHGGLPRGKRRHGGLPPRAGSLSSAARQSSTSFSIAHCRETPSIAPCASKQSRTARVKSRAAKPFSCDGGIASGNGRSSLRKTPRDYALARTGSRQFGRGK